MSERSYPGNAALRQDDAAPVITSFSGSTKSDRCLEVWFGREVSDADRAWLLAALNEKALRGVAQTATKPVSFLEAMNIVERGFDAWKDKPHNAKWYSRIDGTPIPNDLKVNIAEAICHSPLSSTMLSPATPELAYTSTGQIAACKCGSFPRLYGDGARPDDGYRSLWCQTCMEHVTSMMPSEREAIDHWNALREQEHASSVSSTEGK